MFKTINEKLKDDRTEMVPCVTEEEITNTDESRFENPCQLGEEPRIAFSIPTSIPPKSLYIFYNTTFNHTSLTPTYLIKWSASK